MIKITNLIAGVGEQSIINNLTISFESGKNYCILGKNGSGKSTLAGILMGDPKYKVLDGNITLDGENILDMPPEKRSKNGLFLSFQNIPEIPGVRLGEYLRTIYNIYLKEKDSNSREISPFLFKRFISQYFEKLGIDKTFLNRDLNVGFSGGEKRKIELLQIILLKPKYIILDEIDSGLDIDAIGFLSSFLKEISSDFNSIIVITHNIKIVKNLDISKVFILEKGILKQEGDDTILCEVCKNGFNK